MSNSIRIDTGSIRLQINDGPDHIEFNPKDVLFIERFYGLARALETKSTEYQRRSDELGLEQAGEDEMLEKMPAGLVLLREACEFMRAEIDTVFGEGTSQKLFGDVLALDMISNFLDAITPYIQEARAEKIAPYVKQHPKKRSSMK